MAPSQTISPVQSNEIREAARQAVQHLEWLLARLPQGEIDDSARAKFELTMAKHYCESAQLVLDRAYRL
jgi:hypothetical protein